MSEDVYMYTDIRSNCADIYCLGCADEVWADDVRKILNDQYFDNAKASIHDLDTPSPVYDVSPRGEHCSECGEQLTPEMVGCSGCGKTHEYVDCPEDALLEIQDDGESMRTIPWCDSCENENRYSQSEFVVEDERRGYTLRFIPDYTGEMTYRQSNGYSWVYDPTPVYVAGCRRFTLADALSHWGYDEHYATTKRYYSPEDLEADPTRKGPADILFSGVLMHAMKRALQRIRLYADEI